MIDKNQKKIFVFALILTSCVFIISIMISYGLDYIRVNEVVQKMSNHEIDTSAYLVQDEFFDVFGIDSCQSLNTRINSLDEEMRDVGTALNTYKSRSYLRKTDFDYLKRKYFLLELNVLSLLDKLNTRCNTKKIPIIFFYEKDNRLSERQGLILDDVRKGTDNLVMIFTFDIDYEDEPTLNLLKNYFNVTRAPTIIINNTLKLEGIKYKNEIMSQIG